MLIKINIDIVVMVLDLMHIHNVRGHIKMLFLFGGDMSSSVHIDNENKSILVLGEVPMQGLNDTTWTAEVKYPINFTQLGKKIV